MNRDEAIKICVDRLDRWPTRSHDLSLLPFCPDWAWTRINNDVVLDTYSIQPSISESDWIAARLEIVEDQSIENSSGEEDRSDGSTAKYYELPNGATELQHLISHRDMNSQIGEIFRAAYRYGIASHSDKLRDAKKIKFYIDAEIERLEKLTHNS